MKLYKICPALGSIFTSKKPVELNLSDREREILHRQTRGHTTRAIAAELRIAPATVDYHSSRLRRKVGVNSIAMLTRWAMAHSLLTAFCVHAAPPVPPNPGYTIPLTWDASPDPSVTSYRIYAATNQTGWRLVLTVSVVNGLTNFVGQVAGIYLPQDFYATAAAGTNESARSNIYSVTNQVWNNTGISQRASLGGTNWTEIGTPVFQFTSPANSNYQYRLDVKQTKQFLGYPTP